MSNQSVSDFLNGSGAKAFPFEELGDTVAGTITKLDLQQQTDITTKAPKFFDSGAPMMVLIITLQTQLQDDEEDEGLRSFWARGGKYTPAKGSGTSSLTALKDALRLAKVKDPEIGAQLTVTYSGIGVAATKGFSAPKLYTCKYVPATQAISMDDLS